MSIHILLLLPRDSVLRANEPLKVARENVTTTDVTGLGYKYGVVECQEKVACFTNIIHVVL